MDRGEIKKSTHIEDDSIETEKPVVEPNLDALNIPGEKLEVNKPNLDLSVEYEKFKNDLKNEVDKARKKIPKQIEKAIEDEGIDEKIDKNIRKKVEKLDQKIENSSLRMVEVLGIFVALFTFISIDVQIFKGSISIFSATGFSLIVLGSLLSFVFTLHLFLNDNKKYIWLLLIFSVLLISAGIFSIWKDYKSYTKKFEEDFYTKEQVNDIINSAAIQTVNQLDEFKKMFKGRRLE